MVLVHSGSEKNKWYCLPYCWELGIYLVHVMLQMCYLTWNKGCWASLVPQLEGNPPEMQETPVCFLGQEHSPGEGTYYPLQYSWASLVAQSVKNLPAMWETWVQSLGWEDTLEEGMATDSNILAKRIPKDRGAWWAAVHGFAKS